MIPARRRLRRPGQKASGSAVRADETLPPMTSQHTAESGALLHSIKASRAAATASVEGSVATMSSVASSMMDHVLESRIARTSAEEDERVAKSSLVKQLHKATPDNRVLVNGSGNRRSFS